MFTFHDPKQFTLKVVKVLLTPVTGQGGVPMDPNSEKNEFCAKSHTTDKVAKGTETEQKIRKSNLQ